MENETTRGGRSRKDKYLDKGLGREDIQRGGGDELRERMDGRKRTERSKQQWRSKEIVNGEEEENKRYAEKRWRGKGSRSERYEEVTSQKRKRREEKQRKREGEDK